MAKIKEISLTLKRTISDGDYGSIGFSVGEVVSLEEDDDMDREYKKLSKRLENKGTKLFNKLKSAV
jgi:hypothetical protein